MIIQKLLPGVLKEILTHVPTVLFKVIDWQDLMSEVPKISKRILHLEGYEEIYENQKNLLKNFPFDLSKEPLKKDLFPTKKSGDAILRLYFSQLFSPHGVFLDLRPNHFSMVENNLLWHPSGLWTKFNENFRIGLIKVYEGFYLQNEELYLEGLREIGMLDDRWGEKDKNQLANLFKSHFGSALDKEMHFSLDHFQASILKVSNFMLDKEVSISKDFLYLGIYLVTLYYHLEKTQSTHPVKDIFLEVRKSLKPEG